MKYYIYSAEYWRDQPNPLIRMYPCLKDFGFGIEQKLTPYSTRIRDERGRYISQVDYKIKEYGYVIIDAIEKLMELQKAVDHDLIIGGYDDEYGGPSITIYDDYIE